jgi:hypothetical protein
MRGNTAQTGVIVTVDIGYEFEGWKRSGRKPRVIEEYGPLALSHNVVLLGAPECLLRRVQKPLSCSTRSHRRRTTVLTES